MSEIVVQARQAREKLASALGLLQKPEAGNLIDTVAEPVARAMGALHQLESSGGATLKEGGPIALESVRSALAALQAQPDNAVADEAMAHVAGSLGLVHGLAQQAKEQAAAPPAATVAAGLDRTQLAGDPSPVAAVPIAVREKGPAPAAPAGALDATLPTPTRPEALMSSPALDSTQASVRSPVASAAPAKTSPSAQNPPQASTPTSPPPSSKVANPPPEGKPAGALPVEANLGAHSPTNFYKGLSGNDVVKDGGLFVATYDIPPLGTSLWVSVHMPGGYEFQAIAEVRWTRETGAGDAPPGFGCAFRSITEEARALIYRYVRNREPLFHDDL